MSDTNPGRRFNFNQPVQAARQRVEIVVLLDRSGSMGTSKAAAEAAFERFIAEQRATPGEASVTLYQFDNVFEVVYEGTSIQEAPPLVIEPRGATALIDALGETFSRTRARLAVTEGVDGVVVVVITDGHENASSVHIRSDVFRAITEAQQEGWGVVWLAASMDDIAEAQSLGLHTNQVVMRGAQPVALYAASDGASVQAAYSVASSAVRAYRTGVAPGDSTSNDTWATDNTGGSR